jgi:UDP-N-acetylmuramate dehydrogenase
MDIANDVPLSQYSTMGLGGAAKHLTKVSSLSDLDEALAWAETNKLPVIMIGGGSNIVWKDEGFPGLVLVNEIKGFEVSEAEGKVNVKIGGGENWDEVVARTCNLGLSGIEALSLIPGSAGATPVQNVGAYGQEISEVFSSLHAYDNKEKRYVDLTAADCKFSYRNSRFKTEANRFFVTEITLSLTKTKMKPPFYASLDAYLSEHHITDYSPMNIRDAVIDIRRSKLPDPKLVKNCGSFFANPIITMTQLTEIQTKYPDVKYWETKGKAKLPAAWLIDKAGFNNFRDESSGMSTWPKQSLILVNESAKGTADLLAFKNTIVEAVKKKFGIELVQEPLLLP